ncbi:hypothetical protein Riv7116_6247 [Rivularia sp. PCC 7116]|uniref:DUF6174 domain-containing protein n=1 Tax=Rivularia sp. PCC 7116 TaxID=373994 RepID=UPI00029EE874|nr:DUF6174 domain-containing protein [Rivularia sp. PCC 7116]AFY58596.1 hypothetical protein Riv7116_6247 [Rivularia sp. PCC 7116]
MPAISQAPERIEESQLGGNTKSLRLEIRKLRFNRRLWRKQKITNYRYTLSNSCFCVPEARGPVIIEVRNGKTVSVTSEATGEEANPDFFQNFDTIPKLFNVIRDAINRRADRLDVEYDAKFGYPTNISIDYKFQLADEELFLSVTNFEVIE